MLVRSTKPVSKTVISRIIAPLGATWTDGIARMGAAVMMGDLKLAPDPQLEARGDTVSKTPPPAQPSAAGSEAARDGGWFWPLARASLLVAAGLAAWFSANNWDPWTGPVRHKQTETIHSNTIGLHVAAGTELTTGRVAGYAGHLSAHHAHAGLVAAQAHRLLAAAITSHAAVLAYKDGFPAAALGAAVCLLLIALMRPALPSAF